MLPYERSMTRPSSLVREAPPPGVYANPPRSSSLSLRHAFVFTPGRFWSWARNAWAASQSRSARASPAVRRSSTSSVSRIASYAM